MYKYFKTFGNTDHISSWKSEGHLVEDCLSLHYNGANSYLLVNGIKIIKFQVKDSEIKPTPFCLRNISKYVSVDNMKKTKMIKWIYLWF